MARTETVMVHLEDDITGGEADETLAFTFEGKNYEIDLNKANARKFRNAMKLYVEHARRANTSRSSGRRRSSSGVDPKAVRAWARERRIQVPARGRIPAAIIEKYKAAGH
jgi:serine/threonine-protein kinase RIO1